MSYADRLAKAQAKLDKPEKKGTEMSFIEALKLEAEKNREGLRDLNDAAEAVKQSVDIC